MLKIQQRTKTTASKFIPKNETQYYIIMMTELQFYDLFHIVRFKQETNLATNGCDQNDQ